MRGGLLLLPLLLLLLGGWEKTQKRAPHDGVLWLRPQLNEPGEVPRRRSLRSLGCALTDPALRDRLPSSTQIAPAGARSA
eukprot:COSAG02_NODE_1925_length_10344_cov_49.023231_6_plen_80_part_00